MRSNAGWHARISAGETMIKMTVVEVKQNLGKTITPGTYKIKEVMGEEVSMYPAKPSKRKRAMKKDDEAHP